MSKPKWGALRAYTSANITYENLRNINLIVAAVYLLQGLAILLLSSSSRGIEPITTNFLTKDELASQVAGSQVLASASHHLFDLKLAYLVAAFLFIGALAHWLMANDVRKRYEKDLKQGINRVRWIDYALSIGAMVVSIGLLSGIFDLSALLMLFVLTTIASLLGLTMEIHNQTASKPNWLSFKVGILADIAIWIVISIYMLGTIIYGSGAPVFVYFIYGSMFVLLNLFAVNMYLQYKKKRKWSNYLYTERIYILLSLVTKSALAWQIFAGTLR
jgi:hypothetical protein